MLFKGKSFENETVSLDRNQFFECVFKKCTVTYGGGDGPVLVRPHFTDCEFVLKDAAMRTCQFMAAVYGSGPGGQKLIEATINNIRGGTLKPIGAPPAAN